MVTITFLCASSLAISIMGITWPGANKGKSKKCGSKVSEAIENSWARQILEKSWIHIYDAMLRMLHDVLDEKCDILN